MANETKDARQSRVEKLLKKEAGSLKKPMLLVSAAVYALLVGVVVYGADKHVYDGFGKAAPWIVGGIFAFMAVLRLAEYIYTSRQFSAVRSYLDARAKGRTDAALPEDKELDAVMEQYSVSGDDDSRL